MNDFISGRIYNLGGGGGVGIAVHILHHDSR